VARLDRGGAAVFWVDALLERFRGWSHEQLSDLMLEIAARRRH
jgi:hypothetical protein